MTDWRDGLLWTVGLTVERKLRSMDGTEPLFGG